MNTIKQILNRSHREKTPIAQYADVLVRGGLLHTDELLARFVDVADSRSQHDLELLLILATQDGLSRKFTSILCSFLKEKWHEHHEDVVMMLEEIKDESSIDALLEAAKDIPEYDDGRSLAKKCIWALGAINSERAKEKLNELANDSDGIIADAAKLQLGHLFS